MWQYIKSLMILIIYETRAHIQFKSNTSLNEIFCTGGELFERSINGSCPSLYNPQTASAETLLKEAKTQRTNHFSIICPDRSSMRLLLKIAACYFLLVIQSLLFPKIIDFLLVMYFDKKSTTFQNNNFKNTREILPVIFS